MQLFSRNCKDVSEIYKGLVEVIKQRVKTDTCILDGELLVYAAYLWQQLTLRQVWNAKTEDFDPFGSLKTVGLGNNKEEIEGKNLCCA